MSTLLKTVLAVGLLLVFTGSTQALVITGDQDLDTPGVAGNYTKLGSTYYITGGGADIGGTSDQGHFAYAELAGDGSITVKVATIGPGSSGLRKAGLMIRDSLDASAINVSNFVVFDASNSAQRREATGGGTIFDPAPAGAGKDLAPFLRITRSGNVFTYSYSADNVTWFDYPDTRTVAMDGTIFVGLAVTSHLNTEAVTASFKSLSDTFSPATTLTWNESGDNFWDTTNWNPPGGVPNRTTHAVLAGTNTDTVTVRAAAEALTVTVDGGDLKLQDGKTLTVFGSINAGGGGLVEMGAGAKLDVFGGNIAKMAAWKGDTTVAVAADLSINKFDGNGVFPGTFTKLGPGTLRLDNSPAGGVFAESTTFMVDAGTLASKGTKPLGNAPKVILDGATLALDNGAGTINAATSVAVTADSLVNITSGGATLGSLTLGAVTLTTSGTGGVAFGGTTILPGVAAVTLNTGMDMGSGPINLDVTPVTINKTGAGKLVVMGLGTNMANATFNVQAGALVAVHGSNPLTGAALTLNGGELILANNGPDNPALFDNAVTVAANSTLTGGKGGLSVGGAPSVRLGSGAKGLTVNSGKTLTVQTTDSYTLDLAGALAGTGTMTMAGGTVGLSGGGSLDRVNINGGTLNATSPLTINYVRPSGGVLNTSAVLTTPRLRSTGGTVNAGAVLNAASLEVENGVVNTADVVNATTVLASGGALNLNALANAKDAILSGSALVKANQLVLTNSLQQGRYNYKINTGTMTASGLNLLAGVNLSFGGNTLTVSPPAPVILPTGGLVGRWTFNDATANDSSGNGYNGVLMAGGYSTDVPAVLGGKSLDLTGSGEKEVIVETPGQTAFDLDTLTVALWVKGWPSGDWRPYVSKGGESGQGWQFRRAGSSADQLSLTLRGAGDDFWGNSKNINDGKWHFIATTYDGATEAIYVDGVLNASRAQTGTVNNTTSRLVLGGRDNSGWNGGTPPGSIESRARTMLDDVYIYNRGLSQNEIVSLFQNGERAINRPTTNLAVTANATLNAPTEAKTTLGDLSLNPDVRLTLQTLASDPFSFGNLTAGDGSSIVGNLVARDKVSVGSSPGVLDVIGSLTLAGTSVYAWDLDSTGSDLINVSEKLTLKPGWTLKVVTSEPLVYGKHVLFTYGTGVAPSVPSFDLSQAPGWSASVLELDVDMAGNVFLLVPEPATWAMLLAAGVVGLLYARRRRRAA